MDNEINLDKHDGHGHSHDQEEDAIVLHQEKLLPTILLAAAFVVVTLFGLATAGNTKLDISTGKVAFDKVEQQKPMMTPDNKQGHEEPKQEPAANTHQ